jgi:hypothetical protein
MRLKRGQVWQCINVACGAEFSLRERGPGRWLESSLHLRKHHEDARYEATVSPAETPQGVKRHIEHLSELRGS